MKMASFLAARQSSAKETGADEIDEGSVMRAAFASALAITALSLRWCYVAEKANS
jgi:hypothetical protein